MSTLLSASQVNKRVFDESSDAIRVVQAASTSYAIETSAADGDSMLMVGTADASLSGTQSVLKVASDGSLTANFSSSAQKASVTTGSGVILPAFSVAGMKTINIFSNTTTLITTPHVCTLEISPSDSDNVWIATSLVITPSSAVGAVAGTAISSCARRARVSIAAANTNGAFDIYAVAQGA